MPLSIFFSHRTGKRFTGRVRARKKPFVLAIDQEEVIARDYGIQRKKGNGGSQHEG
jgi:hypothetical protein